VSCPCKHRKGIEKEYARVASETGKQTFIDKDAIDGFAVVLEKIIFGTRMLKTPSTKLKPETAYIQDSVSGQLSNLYTLDLSTGKATLVGAITSEVADIAFVGSHLYGLDLKDGGQTMQLIEIDPVTGRTTIVGDIGAYAVGLAYNSQRNVLYATTAKQLVAINLETGASKPIATVANQDYNCGEVAFDRHGKAYITLIGYERRKLLATCDLDTGKVTTIGDIGFPNLASMEFYDDVLYGVTGSFFGLGDNGQLLRIDTTTGAGTLVTITDPIGRWAGISIYEPIPKATSRITFEANPEATESATTRRTTSPTLISSRITSPQLSQVTSLPNLSGIWDIRNPQTDIICVSPIRTVIRREEEIVLIRKVRKVEEIDASPTCPVNSIQVQPESDVL